ncbi:hypothetical protein YC2023_019505 [Brassica napus]
MAASSILLSDLKHGRCSSTVKVLLLRFWGAKNLIRVDVHAIYRECHPSHHLPTPAQHKSICVKANNSSLEKKKQETQALNSQIHASVCVAGVDAAVTAIAGATAVSSSSGKDEQMAKPEVAAAATLVVALYMQAAEVIGARAFGLCCQLCHRRSVLLEIS